MSKKDTYFRVPAEFGGGVYKAIRYDSNVVLLDIANDSVGTIEMTRSRVTLAHCSDRYCRLPFDTPMSAHVHPSATATPPPMWMSALYGLAPVATVKADESITTIQFRTARYRELYEAFLSTLALAGPLNDAHARFNAAEQLVNFVRNYGWEPRKAA